MSDLPALLRAAALLLEQQANVISYAQAAEGRLAELETIVQRLTVDVQQLQEWAGTETVQIVHGKVDRS